LVPRPPPLPFLASSASALLPRALQPQSRQNHSPLNSQRCSRPGPITPLQSNSTRHGQCRASLQSRSRERPSIPPHRHSSLAPRAPKLLHVLVHRLSFHPYSPPLSLSPASSPHDHILRPTRFLGVRVLLAGVRSVVSTREDETEAGDRCDGGYDEGGFPDGVLWVCAVCVRESTPVALGEREG
jgi:hypothetical protein